MSRNMTKPTKWLCAKQRLRSAWARPVWSESSLSAWRNLCSLVTHWVHSENSDQTGWMPRLISVLTGCTLILLVLLCQGSNTHEYTSRFYCLKSNFFIFKMDITCCFYSWSNQELKCTSSMFSLQYALTSSLHAQKMLLCMMHQLNKFGSG